MQKADPAKRSHLQTRLPFHLPKIAATMSASLEKELVNRLQAAEAAEESRKKAKK